MQEQLPRSIYLSAHPWAFVTPPSLAPCGIRPPWMVEVQILQEQKSVRPSMDVKKATVFAVAFWDSFFYKIYCNEEKPKGQRVRFHRKRTIMGRTASWQI